MKKLLLTSLLVSTALNASFNSVDTTYGDAGTAAVPLTFLNLFANGVTAIGTQLQTRSASMQSDDKLILGGILPGLTAAGSVTNRYFLGRFTAAGAGDTTYANAGTDIFAAPVVADFGGNAQLGPNANLSASLLGSNIRAAGIFDLQVLAGDEVYQGNSVIAVGTVSNGVAGAAGTALMGVVKYDDAGAIDAAWGLGGGGQQLAFGVGASEGRAIAVDADGFSYVVGSAGVSASDQTLAVASLDVDGVVVSSILQVIGGSDGTGAATASAGGTAVALDANNKVVVAGYYLTDVGRVASIFIARYNNVAGALTLDLSFNATGIVFIAVPAAVTFVWPRSIIFDALGNIIVVGGASDEDRAAFPAILPLAGATDANPLFLNEVIMASVSSTGQLNLSFGGAGTGVGLSIVNAYSFAGAGSLLLNNQITVGGGLGLPADEAFALWAYSRNGAILAGAVLAPGAAPTQGWELAQQSDAKLVLAGGNVTADLIAQAVRFNVPTVAAGTIGQLSAVLMSRVDTSGL